MNNGRFLLKGNPGSPEQRAAKFQAEVLELKESFPLVQVEIRDSVTPQVGNNSWFDQIGLENPEALRRYLRVRDRVVDLELLDETSRQREMAAILEEVELSHFWFNQFYMSDMLKSLATDLLKGEFFLDMNISTQGQTIEEADQIVYFAMGLLNLFDEHSVSLTIPALDFMVKSDSGSIEGIGEVVQPFYYIRRFSVIFSSQNS